MRFWQPPTQLPQKLTATIDALSPPDSTFQAQFYAALVTQENSIPKALVKTWKLCKAQNFYPNLLRLALSNHAVYAYLAELLAHETHPRVFVDIEVTMAENYIYRTMHSTYYGTERPRLPAVHPLNFILGEQLITRLWVAGMDNEHSAEFQNQNILFVLFSFATLGSLTAFQNLCQLFLDSLEIADSAESTLARRETFFEYYKTLNAEALYGIVAVLQALRAEHFFLNALLFLPSKNQETQQAIARIKSNILKLQESLIPSGSGICLPNEIEDAMKVAQQSLAPPYPNETCREAVVRCTY